MATETSIRMQGTIKRLLLPRGFGFITGDDGEDYYIQSNELMGREWGAESVQVGNRVEFEPAANGDKLRAIKVRVL